ncbi:MAG: hypothetical protein ACYDBO_10225, partial [Vulcanimicrobiaceae bacterium]
TPLAVNPGKCSITTRLRREAGEYGRLLAPTDAFTPTSLLKVSGAEQLREEWIATRGRASYARLQAYLRRLAASHHAPLRAFTSTGE